MAEQISDIVASIEALINPDYRRRLRARGGARAMSWRSGKLPPDSTTYGQALTEELESYAFGLFRNCFKALDSQVKEGYVYRGLELAAESLEAIVRNGNPKNRSRGFLRVMAAAGYHLAGYSARAYSLISQGQGDQNTSPIEDALALLIMRRLDLLRDRAVDYVLDPRNVAALRTEQQVEDAKDIDDILLVLANDNYFRATSAFIFALRDDNEQWFQRAVQMLVLGEELCFERGLITTWWVYRITRFLFGDLWAQSLQRLLPHDKSTTSEWTRLRELFVTSLMNRSISEVDLWPSQLEIANRVMDDNDNIVASLPTSAGKTRIAEICILRALANGRRVVFITPLRALSAQTERTLRKTFSPLGFTVSSLYGAAGASATDVNNLKARHIVVGTPEKLDFALRNDPELLDDVGLVVFDEGHMLGPTEREIRYELLVQRLLRRSDSGNRRIVCLSAMLPSTEALADFVCWLRNDRPGDALASSWRPTKQRFGQIKWMGGYANYGISIEGEPAYINRFIAGQERIGPRGGKKVFPADKNDLAVASAWRLVEEGLSVLIYCPHKRSAKAVAKRVLGALEEKWLGELSGFDSDRVATAINAGEEWLGADSTPVNCLRHGVALHYAGLPRAYLREVDQLIQEKKVPIIVASPTLARGLNISASCVLFQSTQRHDGQAWNLLSAEEFANVAGRAGRAFVDVDGQVLGVCFKPVDEVQWKQLVATHDERKLESGLVALLGKLLHLLLKKKPSEVDLVEYIVNSSAVWTTPDWDVEEVKTWSDLVSILDIALISLIGDEECDASNVALAIDKILTSSLFRRRLLRYNENVTAYANAVLKSRAGHICENSTPQQRRGYFFAGIGFTAGQQLDERADKLEPLVSAAEQALANGDAKDFQNQIIAVAEIIFEIDAFRPSHLPETWKEITTEWLDAGSMSSIQELDDDASEFVEEALVYKLTWGIEALRVRRRALDALNTTTESTPITSLIETGTRTLQQALLIQCGLSSRIGALKVLAAFPGEFDSLRKMRRWLRKKELIDKSISDKDWPTPESRDAWLSFLELHKPASDAELRLSDINVQIDTTRADVTLDLADDVIAARPESYDDLVLLTPELRIVGTAESVNSFVHWESAVGFALGPDLVTFEYIR